MRLSVGQAGDFMLFVIQGMHDNQQVANQLGHAYAAYVEPAYGQGSGLIELLAKQAAVVVTDDFLVSSCRK
ncbi:MAG: hypothetical protein U0936_12400 [Planctomycetaceae bacterium]